MTRNANRAVLSLLASAAVWGAIGARPAAAQWVFCDQTPSTPLLVGAYQRYVTMAGDGTNLALWNENRTSGTIEMRTSSSGYTGFGAPTLTTGLAGLAHPKIYGGGGGYTGLFWDSTQVAPNGIVRLTSTDGLAWSNSTQVTIANSPYLTSKIWGAVGYFENIAGDTDVLYYTQGTGANEQLYRATATDGVQFTHQGTAFVNPASPGLGTGISCGSQVRYDPILGEFMLLWCGESSTEDINYAASADGLSFTYQGTVVLDTGTAGHTDLEETSFVLNGPSLVGVYTADFGGDSSNHIGAYTGVLIPEPVTVGLLGCGALALRRRRRRAR